jgi:hypothetical protein
MPLSPILFLGKSYVGTHVRRLKNGKVITVGPYYDKRIKKGTEHVRAPLGRDFEDVQGLSPESMDLLERMHKEQHLLHHYHGHALRKRIAEHAEAIKSLTETAKAHRAAGKEVEATQAVNRALKRKSDLLRHQKELAEVDAKVAGIGAMMAKISPGAGDVYDSTEDSHKQYVDKMGSRWKASPRSPAKVTIPPAVEQSLMRLLGGFRSYAEGLERARATDQQFNGDGRYANEYAQNNKDRLEASEAFLAAKLGSIVNAANRAAAEEFIAKHRPDTNLTAHEQGFFGAKPADKKDEAIQAAVDHLKEDATKAANRALRAKSSLSRHRRELEEVNAKVAGIGAMKDKMVAGSGAVGESTDEGHNVYAKKLGARWKKPLEGGKPTIVRASARSPAPAADFDDDDQFLDIDGKDVPFEYRLVEADSLGASKGKADNQYRDRTRAASDEQVGSIANNLKFRMLSGSPVMDYGAPVLAMDGETIIAGNGRTLAIQRAYGSGKAQAYKDDLSRKAHRYGLSKDAAAGMKEPVLVRVLSKDVDVRQAAIASNEGGGARMSNLEQAKVDGERLGDLSGFSTNDAGEFNTPANMPFIRQFLGAMPASQRGAFLAADGRLSQEGINRVRNAILYRAYGDSDTLARQVESADAVQRNVLNALVSVAPIVAQAKQDAKIGRIHDLDISADIVAATATLAKIKEERKFGSVDEYLSQAGLFGDEISDEAQLILRHFGEHLRSAKAISEFLAGYYDAVNRLGDPNQMDIFDDAPTPKKTDLLRNSHGTRHEEQAQLF